MHLAVSVGLLPQVDAEEVEDEDEDDEVLLMAVPELPGTDVVLFPAGKGVLELDEDVTEPPVGYGVAEEMLPVG